MGQTNAGMRFYKPDQAIGLGDGGPRFNGLLGKSRLYYHFYFRRAPRKFVLPAGFAAAYIMRSSITFSEDDIFRSRAINTPALQAEHKAKFGTWAH